MDLDTWGAFLAASVLVLAVPGPTVALILAYATTQGRRVALALAAGVALGDLAAMTASLAGVGALMLASATLFTVFKWVGAAYLLWLGIALWRSGGGAAIPGKAPAVPAGAVVRRAFVVTALNPKSIAFFVAFAPQFVDPGAPYAPQAAILTLSFAALNAVGYALLAERAGRRMRRPSVRRWIARAGGATLVAMAAATAMVRRV